MLFLISWLIDWMQIQLCSLMRYLLTILNAEIWKSRNRAILRRKASKGNNKIITFRRCSKTNTSDRITKKTAAGYQKKAFEDEKPAATKIYLKLKWTQGIVWYRSYGTNNRQIRRPVSDGKRYWKKVFNLIPTLSIIGNVPKSTGILILNGEKDSDTQA